MGIGIIIRCKECDYSKNLQIGVGMMYAPHNILNLESKSPILKSLIPSKKIIEKIKMLIESKNAVLANDYGHYIYRCPGCNELFDRFFIHLDYDDGSFEPSYRCGKCRSTLERIDHNPDEGSIEERIGKILTSFPCPKCGSRSLYVDSDCTLMWD